MIVRYVRPLTASQRHTVAEILPQDATPRARGRAHGIVRSAHGMKIKEIAKIYPVERDTVAPWIKPGEPTGVASRSEQPWSGSPPKLTLAEKDLARH